MPQDFSTGQVLTAAQMDTLSGAVDGYATTATAAGTTTLTTASMYQQFFTGVTTQTVTMPVASTLYIGQKFRVVNNSSGVVTVQSSGANTVYAVPAGGDVIFTCILASGTTAASWDYKNHIASSSGGMTELATGTLSSTGVTFSAIDSGYKNLELHITGYNVGGQRLYVRINGDTGNNYFGFWARERNMSGAIGTYVTPGPVGVSAIRVDGEVNPDSGATNSAILRFPAYTTTTGKKIIEVMGYALSTYSIPSINPFAYIGADAAISSITIVSSAGTFSAGNYKLYGVK